MIAAVNNCQVLIWDWWDTFVEPSKLMKVKSSYNWKRNSRQLPRRVRNYKFSQSYLKVGPGSGYRVSLLIAAIIFGASMYCWSLKGESHCTGESHATTVSRSRSFASFFLHESHILEPIEMSAFSHIHSLTNLKLFFRVLQLCLGILKGLQHDSAIKSLLPLFDSSRLWSIEKTWNQLATEQYSQFKTIKHQCIFLVEHTEF